MSTNLRIDFISRCDKKRGEDKAEEGTVGRYAYVSILNKVA